MRSAVPLPCFFEVTKSQKVAGQRPRQGTKSCRMGRNSVRPYICPSIHLSVHTAIHPNICSSVRCPSKGSEGHLVGSEALPERFEALLERFEALPEGSEGLSGGPGGDGRTDVRTDGISPHSTGLCPLSGPLPCYLLRLYDIKEAGQGYR